MKVGRRYTEEIMGKDLDNDEDTKQNKSGTCGEDLEEIIPKKIPCVFLKRGVPRSTFLNFRLDLQENV